MTDTHDATSTADAPLFQEVVARYREATRPPPGLLAALLAIPQQLAEGKLVAPEIEPLPIGAMPPHAGTTPNRRPQWVRTDPSTGELLALPDAATSRAQAESFEVTVENMRSKVTLGLEPLHSSAGGPSRLRVRWEFSVFNPAGWELAFLDSDGEILALTRLGPALKGDLILGEELGFDPVSTPWQYIVSPL